MATCNALRQLGTVKATPAYTIKWTIQVDTGLIRHRVKLVVHSHGHYSTVFRFTPNPMPGMFSAIRTPRADCVLGLLPCTRTGLTPKEQGGELQRG
jgi:hypothetical protein